MNWPHYFWSQIPRYLDMNLKISADFWVHRSLGQLPQYYFSAPSNILKTNRKKIFDFLNVISRLPIYDEYVK